MKSLRAAAQPRILLEVVALAALVAVLLVGPGRVLPSGAEEPTVLAFTQTATDPSTQADRFLVGLNDLRAEVDLPPLQADAELTLLAESYAVELRSSGELVHADDLSIGVAETWWKLGENLGHGPAESVEELLEAFVESPTHYANIVDPDFTYVGIAVVHDERGGIWTVHRFRAVTPNGATAG